MWETSEIKQRGKAAFRMNYWKCVAVSILMSVLTAGVTTVTYNQSTNGQGADQQVEQIQNAFNSLTPAQQIAIAAGIAGSLTLIISVSILLDLFVFNPLKVGCYAFFRENVKEPPADFSHIGVGFGNYVHTFVTLFLKDLFVSLWSLLFIVPGLIKSYSYRMVPYIITDHPELSPTETINLSRQMMNGHKWHAFCYDLSFIGWFILTVLTLGILGVFWTEPYKDSSDAALYLAIKGE